MQNVIFVTAILHLKCYYVSEVDMKLNTNKKEKDMAKGYVVAGSISGSGFTTTSTDRSPKPDFTCGHHHRSPEQAEACREKLMNWNKKRTQCSAKWYNSQILYHGADTDSGYARDFSK